MLRKPTSGWRGPWVVPESTSELPLFGRDEDLNRPTGAPALISACENRRGLLKPSCVAEHRSITSIE